jgi:hypothetical protein
MERRYPVSIGAHPMKSEIRNTNTDATLVPSLLRQAQKEHLVSEPSPVLHHHHTQSILDHDSMICNAGCSCLESQSGN